MTLRPMQEATKPQVFFLDDDDDLRCTLRDLVVSCFGVDCITAASMDELVALRERVLGCVLAVLDVNLGAGSPSGIDAYAWLRAQGFKGRVVYLTGHAASHPLVREALLLGDVHVLEKPVSMEVLEALMAEHQV